MAEATLVQDGIDRVESAVKSLDREFQKLQRDLGKRRRTFEKQTQKRVDRFFSDVRRSDVVKRAEKLRKNAQKRLDGQVETLLGSLQIASKSEIAKIDRKLNQVSKKLREIEKATNGAA